MRAPLRLGLWLLVLAVAAGCPARFSGQTPAPYLCASRDAGECPGGWRCNLAAGFCVNPDAGLALPCGDDTDCGGGWRCSPLKTCADRSVEGPLRGGPGLDAGRFLSPLLPTSGPVRASEQLAVTAGLEGFTASDVLLVADAGTLWLSQQTLTTLVATQTDFTAGPVPLDAPASAAVASTQAPNGPLHSLWWVDGGVRYLAFLGNDLGTLRAGVVEGDWRAVSTVRSPGASTGLDPLGSAVALRGPAKVSVVQLRGPSPTTVASWGMPDLTEVTYLGDQDGGARYVGLSQGCLYLLGTDGGATQFRCQGFAQLRAAQGPTAFVFSALDDGGSVTTFAPDLGPFTQSVRACADDETLVGYTLDSIGGGFYPQRLCDAAGRRVLRVGGQMTALYSNDTVSAEGQLSWWRDDRTGQLSTQRLSSTSRPITLPAPPDALLRRGALVYAARQEGAYQLQPQGFLIAFATASTAQNAAGGDGPLLVLRDGTVQAHKSGTLAEGGTVVAFSSVAWTLPVAPVLVRRAVLPDGGVYVAVTHDDTLSMARIPPRATDGGYLLPSTLDPVAVPSPGLPLTALALRLDDTDGGFAFGYGVAGGAVVVLTATSPTRWQATRLTLPLDALHVYFEGTRGRAVLADGTIVGLTALVALGPPTPAPALSSTTVCGVPFVLTDSALYEFLDSGSWRAVDGVTGSFAGGALRALDSQVYVFDKWGRTSVVDVPCP